VTPMHRPGVMPFAITKITPEARAAALAVLESGWVTMGPEVAAFETDFASYLGSPHAVATSSATSAIEIALRGLRLPAGSPVLTPTVTFAGAVHAIVHAGLRPVPVDTGSDELVPDAAAVVRAARRCGGPAAMVVQHMAGEPVPVEELAEAAGLPPRRVIEDAAHGLGAYVDTRPVGTISRATCFSFYATKNLPIGEGGALTTADEELADFARRTRLHGMSRDSWRRYLPGGSWQYVIADDGLKANMTDLQAAIGRAQLRHLPAWQIRRAHLAQRYSQNLACVDGLRLPTAAVCGRHAWHLYVVQVLPGFGSNRDSLAQELADAGIGTSVHFIPLHHQPYFRSLFGDAACRDLPNSDAVFPRLLSLPLHPALDDCDVDRVCEAVVAAHHRPRRQHIPDAHRPRASAKPH
jgi:dTDP-4-amino-4,6-dideoxygalactose transaminase